MAEYTKYSGRIVRKERQKRRRTLSVDRPRLSVYRSNQHIYAQVIDDVGQCTLVAASTASKELKTKLKKTNTMEAAKMVGELIAKKALEKKVSKVSFDRGGFLYHGRIKALADAAREAGLVF